MTREPRGDASAPDAPDGPLEASGTDVAGDEDAEGERHPRRRPRPVRGRKMKPERRVPAWVVVPLATAAGWIMSGWPGGVFGFAVGMGLWWIRR